MSAHAIAYAAAFYQRNDAEAAKLLETCLEFSGTLAPIARESLMSDAAVFQGRRRERADLAEQWLDDISVGASRAWLRSRAEAAVFEARGDITGGIKKLDECERAICALPDGAQREMLLRGIRRWRSEITAHDG